MKHSDQIDQLAAALAKAQGKMREAERTHTAKVQTRSGGSYTFNYVDLADYIDICRVPLSENGIAFLLPVTRDGDSVSARMFLAHESGQWMESDPFPVPVISTSSDGAINAQAFGSACSYSRKYVFGFLGLAAGQDDDGNAASGNKADITPRKALPACPKCGKTAPVIVGKAEYGGGLLCWQKKDGCGHAWGTPENPLKSKDDLPAQLDALPPGKPKVSEAYKALAHKLELIGCKSAEDANAVLRWVGTDKTVAELKANSDAIVAQIVKLLDDCELTAEQIYAKAMENVTA